MKREVAIYFGSAFSGFIIATLITTSPIIGIPFGLITTAVPVVIIKRKNEKERDE
jgi:hypothetical protein